MGVWRTVRRAVTERGPERDTTVQSLKAAAAALLAWAVAGLWWDAPMAMLAPWSAMFLVQSTVYRSLVNAVQQLIVVLVGTLFAAGAARGWYDRAWGLTDAVTEMRTARRWCDESYRFNPGHRLRRSQPEPPPDWDYTWDRLTEHIRTTLRPLAEEQLDEPVRGHLGPLLRAAGEVCAADGAAGRRRALDRVRSAHRRLAALPADGRRGPASALGGLTADTRRLLDDLAAITEADGEGGVSEPTGTPRRTAGRAP